VQPQFTLRQLGYFVAAADAGSMTGASRAAHVSQSAISFAVADLERELGTQLFIRHHAHGLSLTPAGHRVIVDARELLARAAGLADEARELGDGLTGSLGIACYDTIAPFLMPRQVAGFAEKQPAVQLDLREGTMTDLHHLIRSGGSELMIAYDLDIARDIALTPLRHTRPYVLLPPGHRFADREEVEIEQLVDDPLVLLDQPQPSKYFLGLFEAAGLTPTIGHRTSSFEMVRSLVARSLGYSLLIQRPATDASYEGLPLVCLPLVRPPYTLTIVIGAAKGAKPTRRATAFVEHCLDVLAD
jgi:DNA-binding transcriptional LysR family regulator